MLFAINVVDVIGSEMDVSSLLRFLSEAVWLPAILQPSDYFEWVELILIQRK